MSGCRAIVLGPWPGVAHAARLLLALCGLAGTTPAVAQPVYLDAAVSRLSQSLVQQLELKGRLDNGRVFVSPLDFVQERDRQNLPLSATLYGRFSDELSNRGVGIELFEDDAQGVMVLQGTWRELFGTEGIWLTVKIRERSGSSHRLVASADGQVERVEEALLRPDLESWGRYAVGRLGHQLSGRRTVSLVPFSVRGAGKPEELGRYLDEYWLSEAFTRSRRFTLMEAGAPSDGELRVSAHVVGEHLQISLRIVDGQGRQVGAATIRKLAVSLLPGHFLGPDVAELLQRCAKHLDGGGSGGLAQAWRCYAQVLGHDAGNAQAVAGRRRVEARYVEEAEQALGRGELDEARRFVEELAGFSPSHPRVEGLRGELERATAEAARRAEEERRKAEERRAVAEAEARRKREQEERRRAEERRIAELTPEMVRIEGGCFRMGSPESETGRDDNERRHRVCVEAFSIGKHEVTFAEYDRFAEATGRSRPDDSSWGRERRPVINVSWHDATAYARWLSGETGRRYRLAKEAEWEYAARAGTETSYPWGNSVGRDRANCDGCGSRWDNTQTAPVGSFEANAWGLHDTVGNVREWTCSEYDEGYGGAESRCASGRDGRRVIRGGSWFTKPRRVRSAYRYVYVTDSRTLYLGFRLAQD